MNKTFTFEINKEGILVIKTINQEDKEEISRHEFTKNTITGEDLFNLFDVKVGDAFEVSDNPFDSEKEPKIYKQVNALIDLLKSIVKKVNAFVPSAEVKSNNEEIDKKIANVEENLN